VTQDELTESVVVARPNYAEFADAVLIAAGMYTDVELAFWLNAPQPLLEMWTPIQLLAKGESVRLLEVMRQLETEYTSDDRPRNAQ
jgi:hypothetical protein